MKSQRIILPGAALKNLSGGAQGQVLSLSAAASVVLLCALLLLTGGCSLKEPPAPYAQSQFVSSEGRPLTHGEVLALSRSADYILMGENHDSRADHLAQATLIRLVASSGRQIALGLEMLPHSRFSVPLQDFSSGAIPLDALPDALDWNRSWGYDFALYRPVFAAAAQYAVPIYGLNMENAVRKAVSRKGLEGLTRKEKASLPSRIVPPLPAQKDELAGFFLTHNAMISRTRGMGQTRDDAAVFRLLPPEEGKPMVVPVSVRTWKNGEEAQAILPVSLQKPFERFLLVQSLWDSVMAEQAVAVRKKENRPLLILAGGGHVAKGHGIAYRLRLLEPEARILNIMPFSGERPEPGEADIFFYSPQRRGLGYGMAFANEEGRLRIVAVRPESPAAKAGLQPGDSIVEAKGIRVTTLRDLHRVASAASLQGEDVPLSVERAGKRVRVTLKKEP